jgi:hypothetical protein
MTGAFHPEASASEIYNMRTGNTHSTTGEHTNDSTFRNDPTSASTSGMPAAALDRPSMPPATSSLLSVKSGVVGGKH